MPKQEREEGQGTVGRDALFDVLHTDHVEVDRLLGELLVTDETPKARRLWKEVAVALAVHARAEQDAVYDVLERDQEDAIRAARDEHEQMEDLLTDADAAAPGTDEFFGLVAELREVLRHHVSEEEHKILPKARATVHEQERAELVELFKELKERLRPKVEAEFSEVSTDLGEEEAAVTEEAPRAKRTRAA